MLSDVEPRGVWQKRAGRARGGLIGAVAVMLGFLPSGCLSGWTGSAADIYACQVDGECIVPMGDEGWGALEPWDQPAQAVCQTDVDPYGAQANHCVCSVNGLPSVALGNAQGCAYRNRPGTECIYWHRDAARCSPDEASSCDVTCAEFLARVNEERAHAYAVHVRVERCHFRSDGSTCQQIVQIDEQCFTGIWPVDIAEFDCNLSDADVLENNANK